MNSEYTRMLDTNPDSEIRFNYSYGRGIGYAGVEWFFHSSMSLHAEYREAIRLSHRRAKRTTGSNSVEDTNRNNGTSFSLGGDGVRFGLSVYF